MLRPVIAILPLLGKFALPENRAWIFVAANSRSFFSVVLRLAVRRRDLRPRAIAWMRSADSSSSVFGMVLCHRLYAFSLPHDAVQTGSKAAGRVARFCDYGWGIVLRAWWSVCGCLCVPVGMTLPSRVAPLFYPYYLLPRSFSPGLARAVMGSAGGVVSLRSMLHHVWRLAVHCALISVDGGVGLFSWLNSTLRRFLCSLAAAPSSSPIQRYRCLGSK